MKQVYFRRWKLVYGLKKDLVSVLNYDWSMMNLQMIGSDIEVGHIDLSLPWIFLKCIVFWLTCPSYSGSTLHIESKPTSRHALCLDLDEESFLCLFLIFILFKCKLSFSKQYLCFLILQKNSLWILRHGMTSR